MLKRLEALGIAPLPEQDGAGGGSLQGKTFVVTGTLEGLSRDEASDAVRRLGGRVSGSVSGKTDFLVVGADPGSRKVQQAEQHGVKTLDESAFLKMLGREPAARPAVSTPTQGELFC